MLNLLYILSGHCHISMPKYTHAKHSKFSFSMVWCTARFICRLCNQVSRGQWWNQNGGSRWHCWIRDQNRLISFFERTRALLAEAEQCIYVFSSAGDIEAGETVFILRERASELISWDRDSENFIETWMSCPHTWQDFESVLRIWLII